MQCCNGGTFADGAGCSIVSGQEHSRAQCSTTRMLEPKTASNQITHMPHSDNFKINPKLVGATCDGSSEG